MNYHPFPALLCSCDNTVQEFGSATIAPHDNAIDFTGEFVPLLPLGTLASLCWMLGNKCLAEFHGSVYLSSRELLRIVDLEEKNLAKVRKIFQCNAGLAAQIISSEKAGFTKPQYSRAEIIYLSSKHFTIKTGEYFSAEDKILLSAEVDFLTLSDLPLQVEKRVLLRRNEALLLCKVLPAGDDNFIALSAYSAKLEEIEKKSKL